MKTLTCFFLVCCSFSVADWVRVSVNTRASISFPTTPEKTDFQGNAMLFADIDTGSRVMIMQIDMRPFGLDSAMVAQQYKTDEFMDQLKTGMLGKLPGCSLTGEKRVDAKGWPGYEFDLQKDKRTQKPNNCFFKLLMADFNFWHAIRF